jgi:hypothetical protein
MRRTLFAVSLLLAVAAAAILISYVTVRVALAFQIRRASQLIEAVQSINVGDSENSIRPILERFGGRRWNVQLGSHEDYNYVVFVNPWGFPTLASTAPGGRVNAIKKVLNPRFRRVIGIREWIIDSEIAIKQHQVVAVQTSTIVEGRPMWLGAMWRLAEKPPEFEREKGSVVLIPQDNRNSVEAGILEMGTDGGTSWSIWTTPSSPKGERQMANRLNFGCMRSLVGCDSVCDLLPQARAFFSEHPTFAPNGGGWDDRLRTCIRHDPSENQYR